METVSVHASSRRECLTDPGTRRIIAPYPTFDIRVSPIEEAVSSEIASPVFEQRHIKRRGLLRGSVGPAISEDHGRFTVRRYDQRPGDPE